MHKKRSTGGFSLIEVIVTIAIVAVFSVGAYASINASTAMSGRTQAMLVAEMRVKSAVETLMATGLGPDDIDDVNNSVSGFASVDISVAFPNSTNEATAPYYIVTISSAYAESKTVSVTTNIKRAVGS